MKKLLILSCVLAFCLTLAACHTTDSADSSVPSVAPGSAIANDSSAHQTEPESSLEESRTSQDTAVTSDPIESETTAPAKPANSESTTEPESEKNTESTTPPQTEPETKPAEPPSEPEKSYAGVEDARAVADKVLEYINSFRTSPAVKLSGLTSYAEYRSRQLIGNFAHDTNDERAAATALQYGERLRRQRRTVLPCQCQRSHCKGGLCRYGGRSCLSAGDLGQKQRRALVLYRLGRVWLYCRRRDL